jgi:hypothetical protein
VIRANVVEDAVEHHAQAGVVRRIDQAPEVGLVAQAGVDAVEVHRVVPVRGAGEHRPQLDARGTEACRVPDPREQPRHAVDDGAAGIAGSLPAHRRQLRVGIADRRANGAQRVDVPPDLRFGHSGRARLHPPAESDSLVRC